MGAGWVAPTPASAQISVNEAAHQQFVFAYRLLQQGEYRYAADAFDDFLGRFPKDEKFGDALFFRSLLAHRLGDSVTAERLLQRIESTKLVPDTDVAMLLGQVMFDREKPRDALEALELVDVDKLDLGKRASVLYLRGSCYRASGNFPAAEAALSLAAELKTPLQSRATLDLARVQVKMDKTPKALATLQRVIEQNDRELVPEAARLAGDLAYEADMHNRALEFYQVVANDYQTSKHFAPSVLGMLWARFDARQYQSLLETFKQYKDALKFEARAEGYYLAGSAYQELGNHETAEAMFQAIATAAVGTAIEEKVLYKLAASQYELDKFDKMTDALDRLNERFPKSSLNVDAQFLLALAEAQQGQVARGAARLTRIIEEGENHPYFTQALLQRAKLYETAEQLPPAARDYERYLLLAKPWGPRDLPVATVQEVCLRLVDILYRLGQYERTVQMAQKMRELPDLQPLAMQESLYREARALIQLKQLQPAVDTLTTLLERYPQNTYLAEARYYRGLARMSVKDSDRGMADLLAAAASDELDRNLRANALKVAALQQREMGQDDAAAQTLTKLERLSGKEGLRPVDLLWLARYYAGQGEHRRVAAYCIPILSDNSDVADRLKAEAYLLSGNSFREVGQYENAIQAYREAVRLPEGFGGYARLELAKTYARMGNVDQALGEFEDLAYRFPADIAAPALYHAAQTRLELATKLERENSPNAAARARDEARRQLARLTTLYSVPEFSPLPEQAYIQVAELTEEDEKAVEKWLLELAEKFPDTPYATFAKAEAARRSGKPEEATFLLRQLNEMTLDGFLKAQRDDLARQLGGS